MDVTMFQICYFCRKPSMYLFQSGYGMICENCARDRINYLSHGINAIAKKKLENHKQVLRDMNNEE